MCPATVAQRVKNWICGQSRGWCTVLAGCVQNADDGRRVGGLARVLFSVKLYRFR